MSIDALISDIQQCETNRSPEMETPLHSDFKFILMRQILTLCTVLFTHPVFAQNIGIGTTSPQTPLDVRSNSFNHIFRLDGTAGTYLSLNENGLYRGYLGSYSGASEDVDFGTGGGNTTGKLHLTIQANPKLTIGADGNVGINNSNPQWPLDVNGSINLTGRLVAGGSSGVAGQVLVSNGLAAPGWQNVAGAFQNSVRFEATFNLPTYTSVFNTDATAVTIASSGITINKTGLYHIEGYYQSTTTFPTEPAYFGHSLSLAFGSRAYVLSTISSFPKDAGVSPQASYYKLVNFTQEVYIIAPTTISFLRTNSYPLSATPSSFFQAGRISGYLIAE